jgi:hypothetical protein
MPSVEEPRSFFVIVDSCGSSSSLSDPYSTVEALTTSAGISSSCQMLKSRASI